MGNSVAKLLRVSALVAMGGALSFVVLSSNCGGSSGQRTGTAGTTGTAGATGAAGTVGTAGATGTAGVTGSGGAAGKFMCTPKPDLTCGSSGIHLSSGHITDFSMPEWTPMSGKWCDANGLQGSIFSYSGGPDPVDGGLASSNDRGVDAPNGNFRLTLAAASGGYAGGGLSFEGCVDASAFNAYRFTAWLASGDQKNCTFKAQLQTFEQRPMAPTQNPGGGCDPDAGSSCYQFPTSPNITLTSSPQTFTFAFTDFTSSFTHVNPIPGQLVGLQWQLESGAPMDDGGAQTECMGEIRIDDVQFITQ
jgi:hypothetical protein